MEEEINTHNLIIDFDKHKGERWTRLPISYLKWMVNEPKMKARIKDIAQAELNRRGITTPDELEVSGHAIDSASLRLRKTWHETRAETEGLYTWLYRMAADALKQNQEKKERIDHMGITFCFVFGELYPTLKTVMPAKADGDK